MQTQPATPKTNEELLMEKKANFHKYLDECIPAEKRCGDVQGRLDHLHKADRNSFLMFIMAFLVPAKYRLKEFAGALAKDYGLACTDEQHSKICRYLEFFVEFYETLGK